MKLPAVQPRTRMAHSAAKWAEDNGNFAAFNYGLFKAFFQDGLDIGKIEVILQVAADLGLHPDKLEFASQLDFYAQDVLNDAEMARRAHVTAVPAYVVNGKVMAAGVQSPAQLQHLVALL